MINTTASISFGQALLHHEHSSLRDKIIKLAEERLTNHFELIQCLAGMPSPQMLLQGKLKRGYSSIFTVCFFTKIQVYRLCRHLSYRSIYYRRLPIQRIRSGVRLPEASSIQVFLQSRKSGSITTPLVICSAWNVTVLDLVTAEIRVSKAHVHPHVQTTTDQVSDSAKDLFAGPGGARVSCPTWRDCDRPTLVLYAVNET